MFGLGRDYASGTGVEVKLPRGLTRDQLEEAINCVLQEDYARELWVERCEAELDDVLNDAGCSTGRRVVNGFLVKSCTPGFTLSIRFGDDHWSLLSDPRSTYDTINVGLVDELVARWGMCCSRHELGRPELRGRSLSVGHRPRRVAEWFVGQLGEALK